MDTPTKAALPEQKFDIDTKGSCFICLKYEEPHVTSSYSFQRLSKYLQLNLNNVFNISFPMGSGSALENSDLVVYLCEQCSTEANKFVKLHKDLELIRKRVNTCVARIHQTMISADNDTTLLQAYHQRLTSTPNPLELIQASIANNLRKETIEKCAQLGVSTYTTPSSTFTSAVTTTPDKPVTPIATPPPYLVTSSTPTPSTSKNESATVSSTTISSMVPPSTRVVEVVSLSDSDEEKEENIPAADNDSGLLIKSISGAAHSIITPPSQQQPIATPTGSQSSIFVLQNITSALDPGLNSTTVREKPNRPILNVSEWKKLSDGRSQCQICGKIFDKSNPHNMVIHSRIHAGIKPISCQHCQQTFRAAGNRRIHVLTYHRKELFVQFRYPAVSNDTFKNAINVIFQEYVQKHDVLEDRPYRCGFGCVKTYRHKLDVEAHLVNVHFNQIGAKLMEIQRQTGYVTSECTPPPGEASGSSNNILCVSCGMNFSHPSRLTNHLATGCSSIPFQNNPDPLEEPSNKKTYRIVVKWKCNSCSEKFQSQPELKTHRQQKHNVGATRITAGAATSGTIYKCQYCMKKFKFYYSQRLHMLTLHKHQLFSKYVPPGTTLQAIEKGIQHVINQCKTTRGSVQVCDFCKKDFTGPVGSILQNHFLVKHFQEVVKRLSGAVEDMAIDASYYATTSKSSSSMKVDVSPETVLKIETDPESVLPD